MPQRLNYRLRPFHVFQGILLITGGLVAMLNFNYFSGFEAGPVWLFIQGTVIIVSPLLGIGYLLLPKMTYLTLDDEELIIDQGWPLPGKIIPLSQIQLTRVSGKSITLHLDDDIQKDIHLKNLKSPDQDTVLDYLDNRHLTPEDPYQSLSR